MCAFLLLIVTARCYLVGTAGVAIGSEVEGAGSAQRFFLSARPSEKATARGDAIGEVQCEGPVAFRHQAAGDTQGGFIRYLDFDDGKGCRNACWQRGIRRDADLRGTRRLDCGAEIHFYPGGIFIVPSCGGGDRGSAEQGG